MCVGCKAKPMEMVMFGALRGMKDLARQVRCMLLTLILARQVCLPFPMHGIGAPSSGTHYDNEEHGGWSWVEVV